MDPYELPFALLALLGWVLVLPATGWWLTNRTSGLPIEVQFLTGLVIVGAATLTTVSWVQPG